MNKYIQVGGAFLIATLLFGCTTYTYTDAPAFGVLHSKYVQIGYEGELRAIEDIGIITTDGIIKINSINNKPINTLKTFKKSGLYAMGRYQLHLLPGVYVFSLSFNSGDAWSTSDVVKSITITNGQVLHLSWIDTGRNRWSVKVSDGSAALATIRTDFNVFTMSK